MAEDFDSVDTFIAIAEDCPAKGEVPPSRKAEPTAAEIQYRMLVEQPYRHTQSDVVYASSTAGRTGAVTQEEFFSKPQACLRASPLAKRYGWGIHFDEQGKAAAYAADSPEYDEFKSSPILTQTRGMRSARQKP